LGASLLAMGLRWQASSHGHCADAFI